MNLIIIYLLIGVCLEIVLYAIHGADLLIEEFEEFGLWRIFYFIYDIIFWPYTLGLMIKAVIEAIKERKRK